MVIATVVPQTTGDFTAVFAEGCRRGTQSDPLERWVDPSTSPVGDKTKNGAKVRGCESAKVRPAPSHLRTLAPSHLRTFLLFTL